MAPAVFWAALAGALIIGWVVGLAPDYLGGFGRFILYWVLFPVNLTCLIYGLTVVVRSASISGIRPAPENRHYVLSPQELNLWRSIKPKMERHEVTTILGQPDGPPQVVSPIGFRGYHQSYEGKIVYVWGNGRIYFEPNGGPVFSVEIPEYV
jgi:hypothetical protein